MDANSKYRKVWKCKAGSFIEDETNRIDIELARCRFLLEPNIKSSNRRLWPLHSTKLQVAPRSLLHLETLRSQLSRKTIVPRLSAKIRPGRATRIKLTVVVIGPRPDIVSCKLNVSFGSMAQTPG